MHSNINKVFFNKNVHSKRLWTFYSFYNILNKLILNMLNKGILIIVCLFSLQLIQAQTGRVSGQVMDGEFNDVLAFANVLVKGTQKGTTSDFDGNYSLDLEPGTYTIVFSFVGYDSKELTDVIVESGEVVEMNVTISPSSALRSEEHTSELQSRENLVCRLLLE